MPRKNADKIKEVEIILNMVWKSIFAASALILLFFSFYRFYNANTIEERITYGTFDAILGGCTYIAFRHYFPKRNDRDTESRS